MRGRHIVVFAGTAEGRRLVLSLCRRLPEGVVTASVATGCGRELLEAAEARGYNLKKIVTIASLIEKETDGTDQGNIASVIYNRLDGPGDKAGTNGRLQIDASLLYALPDHEGAITAEDLQTDSPYNLSKYAGLPPTPIANPGLASLMAALEPEETNYYYYALGKDGRPHFFTNYGDHSAFVSSSEYSGNG